MLVGDRRHRLHDGMTGAELLGLQRPLEIGLLGEGRPDLFAAVPIDDVNRGRLDRARRGHDMGQQGPACERLKHLRQRRMHTLALPGGKNHYGNRRQKEDLEKHLTP